MIATSVDTTAVLIIAFSAAYHFALFYLFPASWIPPIKSQWSKDILFARSGIVSTVHATNVVLYVVGWYCLFTPDFYDLNRTYYNGVQGTGDEYQQYLVMYSLGYFVYDMLCMMINPAIAHSSSYLHHVVVMTATIGGLFGGVGLPYHFFFFFEELSTPFLNLKSLLRDSNPSLASFCAKLFALSFFICRTCYGSALYYSAAVNIPRFVTVTMEANNYYFAYQAMGQLFVCGILRVLNLYWLIYIIKKGLEKPKQVIEEKDTKQK